MAACVIVGVKTQTFGPKVAVSASGHKLVVELEAVVTAVAGDDELSTAALAGTAASAPATRAVARIRGRTAKRMRAPH
jgi:hypothetical protein